MSTQDAGPARFVAAPPPLDAECSAALAFIPEFPPLTLESIPAIRQPPPGFEPPTYEELARGGAFTIEERSIPGPAGAPDVTIVICRPTTARPARAALYHVHGGGMISGSARMALSPVLEWAAELGLVVVSVEYRLAPESPFPAQVEDCFAGLLWTFDHADEIAVDAGRVVVVGDSAGGGLAAALSLLARDRRGPQSAGQLLMAPMLDDRNDSPSAVQMAGVDTWDRARNHVGWTALLGDSRGGPDVSPYAAPARAEDLAGLPPAFLDVGSAETFRDEVVDYAARIWRAGGQAELHVWPGGFHGYDVMAPSAAISLAAKAARLQWLRRLLAV